MPVNFRLSLAEIEYIVGHSGADVVYADPALKDKLDALDVRHKFVLGDDDDLYLHDTEPRPWASPDEGATATINYTSGTTARPKGVQLTHRNLWLNATVFGLHAGISDRDVYLHTLPMFHANGWGMPFGDHRRRRPARRAPPGRRHRDPAPGRAARRHADVRRAGRGQRRARRGAATWDGEIPGRDRVRIIVAGAPPPTRTIERVLEELGWEFCQIYGLTETSPLVTVNRMRAEWDDLTRTSRPSGSAAPGAPALGVRVAIDDRGRGADLVQPQPRRLLGAARGDRRGSPRAAPSTPATAATSTTTATWSSPTARRT